MYNGIFKINIRYNRGLLNSLIVVLAISILAIALSYYTIVDFNPYILLIGGSIFLNLIIIENIKLAIVLILSTVFFFDWLGPNDPVTGGNALGLFPKGLTGLPDALSVMVLLVMLLRMASEKRLPNTVINRPLMVLITIGVISFFASRFTSNLSLLLGFRNYFRALPLFFAVSYLDIDDRFMKRMAKFMIFVALFQLPVSLIQKVIGSGGPDEVVGTLGAHASGLLGMFQLLVASIIIGAYICGILKMWTTVLILLPVLIPCGITEVKFFFFTFVPLLFVLIWRKDIILSKRKATLIIIMGAIGYLVAGWLYTSYNRPVSGLFTMDFLKYAARTGIDMKGGGLTRVSVILFAHKNVTQTWFNAFFGVGIGNASHSFFDFGEGYYYALYKGLGIDRTFLSKILWECGYLGLLTFSFILLRLFKLCREVYRRTDNQFRKALSIGSEGMLLVLTMGIFYNAAFAAGVLAYPFWFMMGYMQRIKNELYHEK